MIESPQEFTSKVFIQFFLADMMLIRYNSLSMLVLQVEFFPENTIPCPTF